MDFINIVPESIQPLLLGRDISDGGWSLKDSKLQGVRVIINGLDVQVNYILQPTFNPSLEI